MNDTQSLLAILSDGKWRTVTAPIADNDEEDRAVHVALVRTADSLTFYLNGEKQGETTLDDEGRDAPFEAEEAFSLGSWRQRDLKLADERGLKTYHGLIDELRVSNAVIYTQNFTPPTAPFAF